MQPHDAKAAATQSDEYAWRLFVAVNWPADWRRRTADAVARFGADRPTVWETWQGTADIFLVNGADPGPWRRQVKLPGIAEPTRFETESLKERPNLRHIVAGQMVPLENLVDSARRLTEVRFNRVAYDYIRAHELYDLDGQQKLLTQDRFVRFPGATTQIKAKWRPIDARDRFRYHTIEVRHAGGSLQLYGLTALHIATKDLPNWFWASFEHVDNPQLADGDGWRLPSSDRFACGQVHPDCNRAPSGIGLADSVWRYYRLRGTLTRYVDSTGKPLRLANSELETGFQTTASCITCHSRASIGMVAGLVVRLPVFDDSTVSSPVATARTGFLGMPQADWFAGRTRDHGSAPMFKQLDFVWSLAKAQPKRGP